MLYVVKDSIWKRCMDKTDASDNDLISRLQKGTLIIPGSGVNFSYSISNTSKNTLVQ